MQRPVVDCARFDMEFEGMLTVCLWQDFWKRIRQL